MAGFEAGTGTGVGLERVGPSGPWRRRGVAGGIGAVLLQAFTAAGSAAQTPVEQICLANLVDEAATGTAFATTPWWSARHPPALTRELEPVEGRGDWLGSARRIQTLVAADSVFFPGAPQDHPYVRLRREIDGMVDAVENSVESVLAGGVGGSVVFRVEQNPVTGAVTLLNQEAAVDPTWSTDQVRSVCWASINAWRYTERLATGARVATEAELWARVERWEVFNERGMTPWPWELAVNEAVSWLGSREALEPPWAQMILLRPMVVAEVAWDLGERDEMAAVEVVGALRYINDRRWYVGASFLWTSPSDGQDAGFGALLHLTPWVKAGPVWRDVDGDGARDARLILTIDLYDLLVGPPDALVEAVAAAALGRDPEGG
ncbi:MAG TPA: hypothetical protein VK858_21165 [Longimicrobiales bacterium]|nr:hypothetical protein [Longimicrobiales bacterium]